MAGTRTDWRTRHRSFSFERQPFIDGFEPTIAGMSLCGYLYFPAEEGGFDISQYPAMGAWLERLKALPGWKGPYELLPGERIAPRW